MDKDTLMEQTISDLNKLSTDDLFQIKKIIDSLNRNLDSNKKLNLLKFSWEGALSNEKTSSVEMQKEALNWR